MTKARVLIEDIDSPSGKDVFTAIHGKGLFLGSSEIATAAGLNRFQSPLDLWMRKTGRVTDTIDNKYTRRGKALEGAVASIFLEEQRERDDAFVAAKKITTTYQHETVDFATATPDFLLSKLPFEERLNGPFGREDDAILEIKTTGIWAKKEYLDGAVPDFVQIQLQWQLGVLGIEAGYVGALVGGEPIFPKPFKFSPDVFEQLLELGSKFLELVKKDTPPNARYDDDLSHIRPTEKEIQLPSVVEDAAKYFYIKKEISSLNQTIKSKEKEASQIKNKIIEAMGPAGRAISGVYIIDRKVVPIKASARAASEQVRFTIKSNVADEEVDE